MCAAIEEEEEMSRFIPAAGVMAAAVGTVVVAVSGYASCCCK